MLANGTPRNCTISSPRASPMISPRDVCLNKYDGKDPGCSIRMEPMLDGQVRFRIWSMHVLLEKQ